MKKNSKRFREVLKNVIKDKKVEVKEALDLVKKNSTAKFDESIDVSLKINLKQSKGGDFSLRTVVNLPNGSGKKNKIAVLCESEKADEAKKAGADVVGSDHLIEKIAAGKFDFIPDIVKKFKLSSYFKSVAIRPGKPVLFARIKNKQKVIYVKLRAKELDFDYDFEAEQVKKKKNNKELLIIGVIIIVIIIFIASST